MNCSTSVTGQTIIVVTGKSCEGRHASPLEGSIDSAVGEVRVPSPGRGGLRPAGCGDGAGNIEQVGEEMASHRGQQYGEPSDRCGGGFTKGVGRPVFRGFRRILETLAAVQCDRFCEGGPRSRSRLIVREGGTIVLLSEQMTHLALGVADYGYVLRRGKVVFEGSVNEFRGVELEDVLSLVCLGGDRAEWAGV